MKNTSLQQQEKEGELRFSFGKNWQMFLKNIDEERNRIAEASLRDFLKLNDLKQRTFLDIGCGSGLFSLAAFQLGAERVVSFDYDPFSVECCRYLHQRAGLPANWTVAQGSVLDRKFLSGLGRFDIVYAWGVLHHTGSMWGAVRNAAGLVKEGGLIYFAIYNRVDGAFGSRFWVKVKRAYNRSPRWIKLLMEYFMIAALFTAELCKFKNPFKLFSDYKSNRGMHWRRDIVDWLGGYPFEFASVEEIDQFMKKEFPGFALINLKTDRSAMGLNWFVYQNIKR